MSHTVCIVLAKHFACRLKVVNNSSFLTPLLLLLMYIKLKDTRLLDQQSYALTHVCLGRMSHYIKHSTEKSTKLPAHKLGLHSELDFDSASLVRVLTWWILWRPHTIPIGSASRLGGCTMGRGPR